MKGAARDSRSWAARPVQSAGAPIHLWEKDWAGQETQEATLARLGCPCQCHQGEAQAQAMMGTGMGARESWAEALLTGAWGIALPLAQGLGFPTLPPPSARRAEGGSGITRRPGFSPGVACTCNHSTPKGLSASTLCSGSGDTRHGGASLLLG